ncbi:uncharacterized protein [Amphiura filiformis]|uniref:uncharacterized protein n=1 Tax=Amphiura filiformis TaxID=82378 RepID=UPI003B223BB4
MMNMINAFATQSRNPPPPELSSKRPTAEEIQAISLENLLPSSQDQIRQTDESIVMVMRMLCKHIAAFKNVEVEQHISHPYTDESSKKTPVVSQYIMISMHFKIFDTGHMLHKKPFLLNRVPMGVKKYDENKPGDIIDFLHELHTYVPQDILGMALEIVLFGDGLTAERILAAQKGRKNGESMVDMLIGVVPAAQDWHKRVLLLQDDWDTLYGEDLGARDIGTLVYLRNRYCHTSVTKDVSHCFQDAYELLEFVTTAYVVAMAMHIMGIDDPKEIPNDLPESSSDLSKYAQDVSREIVEFSIIEAPKDAYLKYEDLQEDLDDDVIDSEVSDMEEEDEVKEEEDYDELCLCKQQQASSSPMLYCNNRFCTLGSWFHYDCIGITSDTVPKGIWFCSKACEADSKKKKKDVQIKVDGKRQYARGIISAGLKAICRRDAVHENDGLRIIRHWKEDLLQFHVQKHPKYLNLGTHMLLCVSGAVSERLRHSLMWDRTVNTVGGKGNNISQDKYNELLNGAYKGTSTVNVFHK